MIKQIAVAVTLTLAPAAFAQTYINAEGDCGAVTFHVVRSAGYTKPAETIAADSVADAFVYLPKHRVAETPAAATGSLDFDATIPEGEFVTMAGVNFKPVTEKHETRTDHAKALLFCGATPRADWQRSANLGLEIFPQAWNPGRPKLKRGDSIRFIAVEESTRKLLGDLPMELYRVGGGHVATGTADPAGGMDFRYPAPGRYIVTATFRRPDPQNAEEWLVDTSSLTFDVN